MRVALVIAALAAMGCGRHAFDALNDGSSSGDGSRTDGDVAVDAAPSLCPGSTALVCDGFEQGLSIWSTSTAGGTVSLDTTRPFRGATSIHLQLGPITVSTNNPRTSMMTAQGLAGGAVTGTLYARVWVYFVSPHPTTEFDQIINFADDVGQGISLGTRNGMLVNNDYTSTVYKQSTTTALPLDRWTCLQLEIPSGTLGTARVKVDGTEVADIAIVKASAQPNPTHVYVGMTWVATISSLPAVEVWLDEVIVDSAPTTCEQ